MHMVIRAIVYAKDKEDGIEKATEIFDRMCGDDGNAPFDYYNLFDDEFAVDRWGKKSAIARADSEDGKKLIQEGFEFGKNNFKKNILMVRNWLDTHTDEELFNEDRSEKCEKCERLKKEYPQQHYLEHDMFKHICHCIGMYKGASHWIYDNDGEAITNEEHLKNVLSKWAKYNDSNPKMRDEFKGLNVYVVPADVHY